MSSHSQTPCRMARYYTLTETWFLIEALFQIFKHCQNVGPQGNQYGTRRCRAMWSHKCRTTSILFSDA